MDTSAQQAPGRYGPIEIFRAGSFTPLSGVQRTITEADLREIAASYDRDLHPAPAVIGHPTTDAPAYGWVEHLYLQGGVLKATLEDTEPAFAQMVKAGRFKRVSVSLFLPNSSGNPKPGAFYLKHVGFLGGAAPAVTGLKPVRFAGGPGDSITLQQDIPAFAETAEAAELARLRREVQKSRIDRLVSEGRVLPLHREELLAFATSLDDRETISFSEGNDKSRFSWFLDYLEKQPKVVSFGRMEMPPVPFDTPPPRPANSMPDGYQMDHANSDLYFAAQQIARQKGVSFAEAVDLALTANG